MGLLAPVVATLLADTKEYSAKMDQSIAKMEKLGAASETTGAKMGAFAAKASTGVLALGAVIAGAAVKLAYNFGDAIDQVGLQANLSTSQLDALKTEALKVSSATATSASTIAGAYLVTTKAGLGLAASTNAISQAAKFANAENADLNATLNAALVVQKAHISGTTGLTNTIDIFTTAVKNSRLSASDLTAALGGRAASAFAAYGVDLKSATTLLAGFANAGLTGTRGVMSLKTGFASLDKPMMSSTGKMSATAKVLKDYGLNQAVLASEMRRPGGMLDVLQQMDLAWQKNANSTERAQGVASFFGQVFGTTAGASFSSLIPQLSQLMALYGKMQHTKGATGSVFDQWLKTPKGAIKNFTTTLENALIPLGNQLLPIMTKSLSGISAYLKSHPDTISKVLGLGGDAIIVAMGMKAATIGTKIAVAFGASAEAETLAGPIGAAIGLAILGIIQSVGAKPIVGVITGKYKGGRGKAVEDILGGLWNSLAAFGSGVNNLVTRGDMGVLNPFGKHNVPKWAAYHQSNQGPHAGQVYGPTRPGGTAHWHVRFTR